MLSRMKLIIFLLILCFPAMVLAEIGNADLYENILLRQHGILAKVTVLESKIIINVLNGSIVEPEAVVRGVHNICVILLERTSVNRMYPVNLRYRGKEINTIVDDCYDNWR